MHYVITATILLILLGVPTFAEREVREHVPALTGMIAPARPDPVVHFVPLDNCINPAVCIIARPGEKVVLLPRTYAQMRDRGEI